MRLNSKLLAIYIITGLISLFVIGYYIEFNLRTEKFQTIHNNFVSQLSQIDFVITDFLTGVEYDVSNLAANELVRTRDDQDFTNFLEADEDTFTYSIGPTEQEIINLFNSYRLTHPYANSVYMGRENGGFVRSHKRNRPTQYDPRVRPWYELGKDNPERVMRTTPYSSVTTQDINIGTVKALVDENGQAYGVVGIDVTLRNLTDYISNLHIGENGHIVLVDDTGIVLTGQDAATRFQHYEKVGWDYFQEAMDNTTGFASFATENEDKYLFYYTSPTLGWKIGAVVPTQEIDREVSQFVNRTMVLFAFALLLLGALATVGVRRFIIRPIKKLQKSTELIMQTGDLEHSIEIETKDEIGQLATSFNDMVSSIRNTEKELQKHRDHLEELVKERTAELTSANEQLREEITAREQAEEALQEREQFLILLNDVTRAALETPSLQAMLQTLADRMGALFDADDCYLTLWDQTTQTVIPAIAYGQWREAYGALHADPDETTMTASVLDAGHPLIIQDVHDTPYLSPRIAELFSNHSLLGLPLIANEQKLGAAILAFNGPRAFTPNEIARGEQAAAQVALALAKAQLVETLQEHVVELQARNEELGAFAHTVAHDLKNPASIVVGYAEMLEEGYTTLSDEMLYRFLNNIARNVRRMDTIIDELLVLASVRELEEIETQPLDMEPIVSEVLKQLDFLIEKYAGNVILPDSWPIAVGYGPWIEQVWANYISNAIKYGGRPLRIELGTTIETNRTGANDDALPTVRFWVRDNGPGLSPEEQARLFTPFERLHQVRAEGHGLGLSIVQRIVSKLGGQVGVESDGVAGQGCTFYFTLPGLPQPRSKTIQNPHLESK